MTILASSDVDVALALTVIFGAFGVIGTIAAGVTVARSSTVKQNMELLRGEVADLNASRERLAGENSELRVSLKDAQAEKTELRAKVDGLTREIHELQRIIEEARRQRDEVARRRRDQPP